MIANDLTEAEKNDVWRAIAAPLAPGEIQFRQDGKPSQRDGKYIARWVGYIDAHTVRARLDAVVPGEWDLSLDPLPQFVNPDSTVNEEQAVSFKARLQILGVIRECVGSGPNYKEAATDAFKRAAVRFGIGHELYGMGPTWVPMDGDGKYAKPLEDPAAVFARKQGHPAPPAPMARHEPTPAPRASAPAAAPAAAATASGDEVKCPKCDGRTWDNRLTKRNPKAPDFKCRDRSCDGAVWPPRDGEAQKPATVPAEAEALGGEWDELPPDDLPFN